MHTAIDQSNGSYEKKIEVKTERTKSAFDAHVSGLAANGLNRRISEDTLDLDDYFVRSICSLYDYNCIAKQSSPDRRSALEISTSIQNFPILCECMVVFYRAWCFQYCVLEHGRPS